MGRSHYIRDEEEICETTARSFPSNRSKGLSYLEMATIAAFNGFQLPPKLVRQELTDDFAKCCSPWMPVLHEEDVRSILARTSSPLLAQSLYGAATRVSPAPKPLSFPSIAECYKRAKILFWMEHETNLINAIKTCLMLQWYNPEGPEYVSLDTSEFWMRTGVGLAYQVGLYKEPPQGPMYRERRRLWWSLVTSLISAAHGRPRAINLNDCDVRPPKVSDLKDTNGDAGLFVRYVEICRILGDLTECCAREFLPSSKIFEIEGGLIRWIDQMPLELRVIDSPCGADFNPRQIHLPYLMSMMILLRFTARGKSRSAVLAASYSAGIFEGMLGRDEVRFLAPVFTIYCICTGFTLLTLFSEPRFWPAAQLGLNIIMRCLSELSKRWRSAIGGLKAIQSALKTKEWRSQTSRAMRG
ncbi:hypothetical protein BCR34DRAFT_644065 [Clohesyomyces aquaticus]|uniref:Xylanolytic transcriptional activator regulatory domain-containing protein n=1 Tax=Clohesyomyces aquaticus TaxID=1231657 RepID=A0A1Y1YCD7_9PLEO|nr:hypothetical protein BCR34DRAFT_644065 [Clohesyomyces aquaticus]